MHKYYETRKRWNETHQDRIKEYRKKWTDINNDRKLRYKGKAIYVNENPRKGICSICGYKGMTNLHHLQYHDNDPLKDTIELCAGCHRKQHVQYRERDYHGRFI